MMQREIMFKQRQDLQRRQQLQELSGSRSQDYVDQLTSSKQASAVQLAPTGNRTPIRDSGMLMFDNMQMIQQGESSIFQGFSNGLVLPQGHSTALGGIGMSPPQFDMSLYGTRATNAEKDWNLYSFSQGPSNYSANPLSINNNSPLGMSPVHPSAIASSFTSQQGSFSADQNPMSDGSFLSSQVFHERNLFGQVPFHSSNNNLLSVSYSPQGTLTQRSTSEGKLEDTGWPGNSPGEVSKVGISDAASSLDPLEQKILYSSDDQGWLSSFGGGKMGAGDFECTVENPSFVDTLPSIQMGSWSALMQSAVTETSSSDTALQEEWSGLSFQNPEPSSDNQPSNFSNGEKLQDNWVDRNLQNVSSPSSEPEQLFQRPNMTDSFPGFQHSGKQYVKAKDEFQCESSHVSGQYSPGNMSNLTDYNSQLKHHPVGGTHLVQTSLLSENTWPAQYKENLKTGLELKETSWRPNPLSGGFQMPIDQPNFHSYSVESEKMGPGGNVVNHLSAHLGASDVYDQNVAAHSMLPNSQGWTQQSYSLFPSLPMGNSNVKSLPNSYEKDYIKNQHPMPPVPSQLPAYSDQASQVNTSSLGARFSLLENAAITQPSGTSVSSQHVEFQTGILPWGPDVTTRQDLPSPRAKFSSSVLHSPGSASTSLGIETRASVQASQNLIKHEHDVGYHEQRLKRVSFLPENSTKMHNSTPLSSNTDSQPSLRKYYPGIDGVVSGSFTRHASPQPSDQLEQKDVGTPVISVSDSRAFGHSHHSYSLLQQLHQPRDCQTDYGRRFPINYEQETANAGELLLSGENVAGKYNAKSSLERVLLGPFSPSNNECNFIQEAQEDQSGKASSTDYLQSSLQMEIFSKNDHQSHSIDSKEASDMAYQSQISLQMAPSWLKQYGDLTNDQTLSTCNPKAAITAMQPLSSAGICPSSAANLIASAHLSASPLPSDATCQDLAVSNLKKRKIVAFDMVPWHKELSYEELKPQNIRAEFEWAQALNRRQEEVRQFSWCHTILSRNEAEIVDDVHPVVQAKRRLIFTTQLMQQVFRPSMAAIYSGDAISNCDSVAYSAARSVLGDACNLNCKMPSDSNDKSPGRLKTSKRTMPCDFSNIMKCLLNRAEKLEGDLSRLDRSLSVVDIKVQSQELEKFSTLNRFAKFHFKVHPSPVDPASSSGSSALLKTAPQRYVIAVPMPKIFPPGTECIPL